jgi:hypothetical protein
LWTVDSIGLTHSFPSASLYVVDSIMLGICIYQFPEPLGLIIQGIEKKVNRKFLHSYYLNTLDKGLGRV